MSEIKWEIRTAYLIGDTRLSELLGSGWEPFGAFAPGGAPMIVFRKKVEVS